MQVDGFRISIHSTEPSRLWGKGGHKPFGGRGKKGIGQISALFQAQNDVAGFAAFAVVSFH